MSILLPAFIRHPLCSAALVLGMQFACLAGANAQSLPLPVEHEAEARVLPVWSNASGRVEALLLLESGSLAPELAPGPSALERLLAPATPALGIGARYSLNDGSRVRGTLQWDGDMGLALLCNGSIGLSSTLGALAQDCLLATLASDDPLLNASGRSARARFGWQSADQRLDLSFGLSWLEFEPNPVSHWNSRLPSQPETGTGVLSYVSWIRPLEHRGLRVDGLINLGPRAQLLLGGDVGRNRLISATGTPLRWDTSSLSVGLGYGEFSGLISGRLVEVPGGNMNWAGLDIGLSWRTPWQGQLSVGARNVLRDRSTTPWPLNELPPLEDPSPRTPYVRYQQDL